MLNKINTDAKSYFEKFDNFAYNAEVIERYNSGFNKCESLIVILDSLSQEQKEFKLNIYKLSKRLNNLKIDFDNPIYRANEYLTLKNIFDNVDAEINKLSNYDISSISNKIEGYILSVVNATFDYHNKVVNEDLEKLNSCIANYETTANRDIPFCPYSAIKKAVDTKKAKKNVERANACLKNKLNLLKTDLQALKTLQESLDKYNSGRNLKCVVSTLQNLVVSAEKSINKANNI